MITEEEERRYAELQQIALDYARDGETDALAEMVRAGMPVNLADREGNTLLMLATCRGYVETARMLLVSGAEVDRRNDRGQTPLGGAASGGYGELVDILLQHGADVDADNGDGMTPIMFASMFGRTAVVEQLQNRGASVRTRNKQGVSARWMFAVSNGVLRFLHRVGAVASR